MKYRKLGNSDLTVSEISLGSWLTYSGGVEEERAATCVARAFDVGINFIDTANVYGRGAAETFLGKVLKGKKRDSYVLATKVFFPMSAEDQGLSAKQIEKQLDASLKRLQVDHVDLYQCHRYDAQTPLEETMTALTRAVKSGKVRWLGMSEWTAPQIAASRKVAGSEPFVSSQPQYSMLWRVPEAEVIPACERLGIGQIVWSPLAQGVLTGKYAPGQKAPAGTRAADPKMGSFLEEGQGFMSDATLTAVQRLRPIAAELGLSMAQLALAWVLRQPNVSSAIIGATRPEQIDDNVKASGVTLSGDVLRRIDDALEGAIHR